MPLSDSAIVAAAALLGVAFAIFWILRPATRTDAVGGIDPSTAEQSISVLFKGQAVSHVSKSAADLFKFIAGQDDWAGIRDRLGNRFPELPTSIDLAPEGTRTFSAKSGEDSATVSLTRDGDYVRMTFVDKDGQQTRQREQLRAAQAELEHLRRASDTTPHAIWQVGTCGHVQWCNAAYHRLFQRVHKTELDKTKPIFDIALDEIAETGTQRISIQLSDQVHKDWYDVTAVQADGATVFHALEVNAVVKSEIAQRNFVQTLAKTFAQLSIGLAIFDRNGQLALFNPALIDLTALPADFLSGRPTLMSFFDRIRENRRMPEPKNYQSWRHQITEVIAAATDGRYQETWTLETGQTFRVNGRPHPDGAIAFLIEDITAEVSLTRNFRAELELGQSLLDTFDDALVVFSASGVLTFSNHAYHEMWGVDPDNSFADVTIADSVAEWTRQCKTGANWTGLADFVLDFDTRPPWEMSAELLTGDALSCSVSRSAQGATIVRFARHQTQMAKSLQPLPGAGSF